MSTHSLTLIIFELLPPYGKEIANIMAFPEGLAVRFRYKRKWFATDTPLDIAGTDALVALRVTRTSELLPIRFGKVLDVKEVGDIFYIVVQVGAFVELNSGSEGQKEQLSRFNRDLKDTSLSSVANIPGEGMEKLIVLAPKYDGYFGNPLYRGTEKNRQLGAWGTLVEILIHQEELRSLDFLCIVDFEGRNNTKQSVKNGEFLLAGQEHYTLRIMQRRSKEI